MNNYSCLDYWYFFWGDFCKEIQITGKQFMGLFNEAEIPNHRYSQVPQNIIEQQVLRTRPVTPKDVVIDIKKLQNDMTHKTDNKLQNNMTHKTDTKEIDFIKDFILISQYDNEFEVLDMV